MENAIKEWLFEEALPADYREQLTGEDDGPLIVLYLLEIERVMDDKLSRSQLIHKRRDLFLASGRQCSLWRAAKDRL